MSNAEPDFLFGSLCRLIGAHTSRPSGNNFVGEVGRERQNAARVFETLNVLFDTVSARVVASSIFGSGSKSGVAVIFKISV